MKGGHLAGDTVHDLLVEASGARPAHRDALGPTVRVARVMPGDRLRPGAGPVLKAAVERARAYVRKALETAPGFGKGHGPR